MLSVASAQELTVKSLPATVICSTVSFCAETESVSSNDHISRMLFLFILYFLVTKVRKNEGKANFFAIIAHSSEYIAYICSM